MSGKALNSYFPQRPLTPYRPDLVPTPWYRPDRLAGRATMALLRLLGADVKAVRSAFRTWQAGYYLGGYLAERQMVDRVFVQSLTRAQVPRFLVRRWIRIMVWVGNPKRRVPGWSWAWGGGFFEYGDRGIAVYVPRNGDGRRKL